MPLDPAPPDPFQTLGLSPSFDIDPAVLDRAYLAAAATAHPDIAGPDAAAASARINHARSVLRDPESRASAFLEHLGGPSKEASRDLPSGFLVEMMETRESIELAQSSGDRSQIALWNAWADQRRADYSAQVRAIFNQLHAADPASRADLLASVRTLLNAWRYVERLIEQLDPDDPPPRATA